MSDYDIIYNLLTRANINFSIGQTTTGEYYISIPATDPYESDVLIEFNYDMRLEKILAP